MSPLPYNKFLCLVLTAYCHAFYRGHHITAPCHTQQRVWDVAESAETFYILIILHVITQVKT